jgi:hypothetical protein
MRRSMSRRSAVLVALLLAAVPAALRAGETDGRNLRDAQTALNASLSLIRRMLHLGPLQEGVVSHAIAVSGREATLELELSGGRTRTITFRGGRVTVDGADVGSYASGGALERSWRHLLADAAQLDTRALVAALRNWHGTSVSGADQVTKGRLDDALGALAVAGAPAVPRPAGRTPADIQARTAQTVTLEDLAALDSIGRQLRTLDDAGDAAAIIRRSPVHVGDVTVAAGHKVDGDLVVYHGAADVYGEVSGSVVALFGDVIYHSGAVIGRDAVAVAGKVVDRGGAVHGDIRVITRDDLASGDTPAVAAPAAPPRPAAAVDLVFRDVRNVIAVFIACAMLGFGAVFFGRRNLEIIADTATHSFGRSFTVGLLGQLLLLPTFAMLVVGLVFTLVGILLLPFAALAYVLAAILALVAGYLAVAHAVGETVARRRMAHGAFVRAPNAYGYLFTGLIGLLGLWAAAALTGWMGPVVFVFRLAAAIVTWLAATTGFGAVLLSRAGLRESFSGRQYGESTDEYLWATPPATPTAARMKMDRP